MLCLINLFCLCFQLRVNFFWKSLLKAYNVHSHYDSLSHNQRQYPPAKNSPFGFSIWNTMSWMCSCSKWLSTQDHTFPSESISFHSSVAGKKGVKNSFETHCHIETSLCFFDKKINKRKIPIATCLSCFPWERRCHLHFNNSTDNAKMDRDVWYHRGGVFLLLLLLPSQFNEQSLGPDKRDPRFLLQFNWLCQVYAIS